MGRPDRDKLTVTMRYLARIISTFFAAFVLLFAIGGFLDNVSKGTGLVWDYEHIKMPVCFILIAAGTLLGWWRDILGGVILTFVGLVFSVLVLVEMGSNDYWIILIFALPFIVCGALFLLSWLRKRKLQAS